MMVFDIEELKRLKENSGYSYGEISDKSGVPVGTVQKVLGGITEHPRRGTLEKLSRVFMDTEDLIVKETEFRYNAVKHEDPGKAEEIVLAKHQGEFTLDDYYVISEKWRIELIDGVIYDMTAPSVSHQTIAGGVYHQLMGHAIENEEDCTPFISPLDVRLDKDDKTMVQPDVIIVCDPEIVTKERIEGAPEFVLEVISPSSRSKDMITKRDKYRDAGCKEYWLIDPDSEKIRVFGFESGVDGLYTFDQKVPVQISGGKCEVDFSLVKKYVDKTERIMKKRGAGWE